MDSKHNAAGSENSFAEKNSELVLSDQIFNCSVAAALNVSAATRPTFFFALIYLLASLPTVAVLPTPLIKNVAQTLSDKYGKGSLDIETGTFTPSE